MNPQRAVFPTELFEVARTLAAGYESFRREVQALADDEFLQWPETAAYSHGWQAYPFVMTTMPAGFQVNLYQIIIIRSPDYFIIQHCLF